MLSDGIDAVFVADRSVYMVESTVTPVRLLGDGCGCERVRTSSAWVLTPCDRHARELFAGTKPNPHFNGYAW